MKNINKILLLLIAVFLMASCTPDEFDLGTKDISKEDLVEGIAYTIEHDVDNPNIIYLTSLMDSKYTPLWNHPQGRSQENKVTLKIPFAGEYDVQFGVQTRGGYVYGDTVRFSIDQMYAGFIDNELWTYLTGGVGNKKTWRLDYGDYGLAAGPLTYCEPHTTWTEWQAGTAAIGWAPSWSDNQWIIEEADKDSRMTFSLIDGAVMTTHKVTEGLDEVGTFLIDVDNHTITTTDATILRSNNFIANASNWNSDLVILELTENQLMIGVRRTNEEGDYLYAWNFVSDDYAENYVPEDLPDPEPTLPDGWLDDVSKVVSYDINWVLSAETPFNWANLSGTLLNADWVSPETYADWTGFNGDVPATYANFSLKMNAQNNTVEYTAPDGTVETGTYELDEKGIYTFTGVTPSFNICSWVNLNTSSDNTWRITSIEKDLAGHVTGMWVGVRDPEKAEYMVYKLVPQVGSGDSEVQGTELAFDNSKLVFGDLEEKGNLRLELYNEYGSTVTDPPLDPETIVYNKRIEITFTLGGIALDEGAVGSYQTAISYSDPTWTYDYWGDGTGPGEVTVNGDGTYTVYCEPSGAATGAVVFVVDVLGLAADVSDLSSITATVDKIVVY
ncbi:hypothetical protein [Saccharicrinis fermentans]|uniref:Uncharacterized protein n=1 Tax=Saccharicrinis fermentans DSM 9555 = JCM 21142 TaxID=869213 RepID=W7Y823_9BACT|nr:hypothetical protein [Saccharicrinis fermentans]GAF03818.1 hypothetical protein JCM21142_62500 [Saccharicrinis fermentans DSM 9555 = JCM 21142]